MDGPGLRLNNAENIIDDAQKLGPAAADIADEFLVAWMAQRSETFLFQEFGKTDDRVQRRLEFVTDTSEEFAFRTVRLFRLQQGGFGFFLQGFDMRIPFLQLAVRRRELRQHFGPVDDASHHHPRGGDEFGLIPFERFDFAGFHAPVNQLDDGADVAVMPAQRDAGNGFRAVSRRAIERRVEVVRHVGRYVVGIRYEQTFARRRDVSGDRCPVHGHDELRRFQFHRIVLKAHGFEPPLAVSGPDQENGACLGGGISAAFPQNRIEQRTGVLPRVPVDLL